MENQNLIERECWNPDCLYYLKKNLVPDIIQYCGVCGYQLEEREIHGNQTDTK